MYFECSTREINMVFLSIHVLSSVHECIILYAFCCIKLLVSYSVIFCCVLSNDTQKTFAKFKFS